MRNSSYIYSYVYVNMYVCMYVCILTEWRSERRVELTDHDYSEANFALAGGSRENGRGNFLGKIGGARK